MRPDATILELAKAARATGFFARLGAGGRGMAAPGAIRVAGKDALSFLHSQVTNDVEGLSAGQGNASARVTRQGQLLEIFSVHRLADEGTPELLLLLEAERVGALLAELDSVLFADDVTLRDVTAEYGWATVQGPAAPAWMDVVAPLSSGSWVSAPSEAITPLCGPGVWRTGSLCIARSLGGDAGYVLAVPVGTDPGEAAAARLHEAAEAAGLRHVAEPALSALLEVLRIEAGIVRIGPDTRGRRRILPETGLEQRAVSYSKGCYLGQEVIARVRTYGALPFSLRGLVFEQGGGDVLDRLPEPGADVVGETGKTVGQLASRSISPVLAAPVAYAYLDKTHRTPGEMLSFRATDGSLLDARIVLLPFYSAPDSAERVAWLYDRAVRAFAGGRGDEALRLLEDALRIDPGFSDGYEAIGVMLGRSERFHEAIDIFKRLEEIAPAEPLVNTNLSLYFMKIGDKETAEDHAAKAMQKSMARSAGRKVDEGALDEVMAEQKRSDARRKKAMFEQVLEIDSEDGIALFGLGSALSVLGELESAEGYYARAARVERDNSAVYLGHGKVLERLGRSEEAAAVYRQGMEVASRKGDLMPLREMEHRVLLLGGADRPDDGR